MDEKTRKLIEDAATGGILSGTPSPISMIQEMGATIQRLSEGNAKWAEANAKLVVALDEANGKIAVLESCISSTYEATKAVLVTQ